MLRVGDPDFLLYEGDALEILPLLGERSVHAVVTSPPYLDARADVRWGSDLAYGDWAVQWLRELARVLHPEGSLMLNLGRLHRDGEELDYWLDVLGRARRVGWRWLDTIVVHKVNGGGGRWSPYLIDRHEYVFWLSLSVAPHKGFDEARVPYSPATLERFQRRWSGLGGVAKGVVSPEQGGRDANPLGAKAGTVFVVSVGAEKGIAHPTPMAPELAEHLIKLACLPGGTVLDPFAGACTTALAARKLGRRAVCVELDPVHCAEGAARLAQQPLLLEAP